MPEPSAIALFAVATLALLVVPGPSVLYIVTRGITQGRMAALVSVLGIHAGTTVHVAAAAFGVSALLMRSVVAFNVVKYAGAAYLIVLGIRRLMERSDPLADEIDGERSLMRIFGQGIVVNVLNPKTALFFFAFLPQFIDAERGSATVQMLALGMLFIALGVVSDGIYALVSSSLGERLRGSAAFARRQRLFSGGVFVALGITAALAGHRSAAE